MVFVGVYDLSHVKNYDIKTYPNFENLPIEEQDVIKKV